MVFLPSISEQSRFEDEDVFLRDIKNIGCTKNIVRLGYIPCIHWGASYPREDDCGHDLHLDVLLFFHTTSNRV